MEMEMETETEMEMELKVVGHSNQTFVLFLESSRILIMHHSRGI